MRFSLRLVAALFIAAGAAACTDTRTITTPIPPGRVAGRVAVAPVFSASAKTIAASIADFGITFDRVRVRLRNTPDTNTVVIDTTVAFGPSSASLELNLIVPVVEVGQKFSALLEYIGPTGIVYSGSHIVESFAPDGTPPEPTPLILNFVGPGATLKTLTVTPKPVKLVGSQTLPLTIAATDSNGAALAVPPLVFASSDESVAKVVTSGSTRSIQSFGKRGQARITATTPIGIQDTLTAVVSLPAASVAVVSGADQSATVGTQVAQPLVVQVSASDGVGVPDVTVTFTPPAGASVGSPTAVTDANGRASTTLTLGTVAGVQSFGIAAAGTVPPTSVGVTARPGPASAATSTISANVTQLNADNQSPAVVTVRTRDQYGNAIATGGATVTLTTNVGRWGTGTATTTTAIDNNDGTYSAQLRSAQAGVATITGTVGGVAIAAPPVSITLVSTARITVVGQSTLLYNMGETPTTYPVVKVTDGGGNPVSGQKVTFAVDQPCTVTSSLTTDAQGQIVFTNANLTIPQGQDYPFSCRLSGSIDGGNATPVQVALVVRRASEVDVWTGATSSAWETRDNWTVDVPSSSLDVWIPKAQARESSVFPIIGGPDTFIGARSLEMEAGTNLNLNGHRLSISLYDVEGIAGIDASPGTPSSAFVTNGTVDMGTSRSFTSIRGIFPTVNAYGGPFTINDLFTTTGDLSITGGSIAVPAHGALGVAGNFATAQSGALIMNEADGVVTIGGSATFGGGAETGLLTAGQLVVGGDFTQTGTSTFTPTQSQKVLVGATTAGSHTITFADVNNSWFNELDLTLTAGNTVTVASPVSVRQRLVVLSANGGTLALLKGLSPQQNGEITLSGPSMLVNLGGTINTTKLTFAAGSQVRLEGSVDGLQLANGALTFEQNAHVTINATGAFTPPPAGRCTRAAGVVIDGSNTAAVKALNTPAICPQNP